jgi:hypothetical protein
MKQIDERLQKLAKEIAVIDKKLITIKARVKEIDRLLTK